MVQVNEVSETLKFQCEVAGIAVRCIASCEFFEDCFGASHDPASWLATYQSNLGPIHAMVSRRYLETGQPLVLLLTDYGSL